MNPVAAAIMSLLELPREVLCKYLDTYSLAHLSFTCKAAVAVLAGVCSVTCRIASIRFTFADGNAKTYVIGMSSVILPLDYVHRDIADMRSCNLSNYALNPRLVVEYGDDNFVTATSMKKLIFCGKGFWQNLAPGRESCII